MTGLTQKEVYEADYKSVNKLLTVKEKGPFKVTLMVEPKQMERTIEEIEVTVLGLNDKFYLKDDIMPVWITLEGSMPVLEDFIPGRRFVTVDLAKITEPGEYDVPVVYNIPNYFELLETSDEIIHIEVLEHKAEEEIEEGAGVNE